MGSNDFVCDGQAEPTAPGIAASRVVEPNESVEYGASLFRWDPRTVVSDRADDTIVDLGHGDLDPLVAVPQPVVDEVDDDSLELIAAALDQACGDLRRVDVVAFGGREAGDDLEHEVIDIDEVVACKQPTMSRSA